jgi:hypothetical protein
MNKTGRMHCHDYRRAWQYRYPAIMAAHVAPSGGADH